MKTSFLKPGFEFIFSLSLIVILGLPPMLMAQNQKDLEIKIENGDTTINGKNIRELSPADRQNALRDINHLRGDITINTEDGKGGKQHIYFFKRDSVDGKVSRMEFRKRMQENGDRQPFVSEDIVIKDSLGNIIEEKPGKFKGMGPKMNRRYRSMDEMPGNMEFNERNFDESFNRPMMRFERRNSQSFDYVNTDKDGISTHMSIHVSDASREMLKEIARVEEANLEIKDLTIVPEFTSGKTVLMFNLPAKTIADVKLKDSEGKIIWSDKSTGGSFSKAFVLGLNGIYYLQVKQGKDVVLKRIMKEE
jgi:hypothetical protein